MSGPRIRGFADGTYLLEYDELGSTQDEAMARAKAGEERLLGVRADYQICGRGRRGSDWYAPRGECLLITYLVAVAEVARSTPALTSMSAAIAVAEGIARLTGLAPRLRWPNDVVLKGRKVAGTLVELSPVPLPHRPTRHVAAIGIGVNVNVAVWPETLASTAISLRQASGRMWPIENVESSVRAALTGVQRRVAGPDRGWVLRAWNERDATVGGRYLTYSGKKPVAGTAVTITDKGELVLRTDRGEELVVTSARHVVI